MKFNFFEYMENVAVRLKQIRHTQKSPRFHRATILTDMEEAIANMSVSDGYNLIALDGRDYTTADSGNGPIYKRRVYSFFVVKKIDSGDIDGRELAINESELIMDKILARMFKHQIERKTGSEDNGLRDLDRNSIVCGIVGPLLDNMWGMSCMFTITEMKGLVYQTADWDE